MYTHHTKEYVRLSRKGTFSSTSMNITSINSTYLDLSFGLRSGFLTQIMASLKLTKPSLFIGNDNELIEVLLFPCNEPTSNIPLHSK